MISLFKNIAAAHNLMETHLWPTFARKETSYRVTSLLYTIIGLFTFFIFYITKHTLLGFMCFIGSLIFVFYQKKEMRKINFEDMVLEFNLKKPFTKMVYVTFVFLFSVLLPLLSFITLILFLIKQL